MLNAHVALTILNLFISTCLAVVSYTVSGSNIVVTTNSVPPFIVTINKNSADITSILFNGIQYQSSSKQSQIGSGLGTAPCAPSSFNDSYVKVVCVTSTLQQTYVFRSGDSNIYMSTYTTAEPSIGELRWISRLSSARLPNGPFLASSIYGNTQTVEGSDVFRVPYQGVLQTRSKFYSSQRFIDDQYHYIYGNSAYATMVMPGTAYETSSGGPFFRDINDQNVTDIHELYFYMNSGHVQTESFRTGQFGPYALAFSTSKPDPSIGSLDLSFFEQLNITGLILKSQRGYVNGTISNSQSYTGRYILHWYNTAAQYWTYANATYMSPAMKPGNYTVVVYREEFMVATGSVPVYPGVTNTANIVGRLIPVDILWQIGKFDGQPFEFQNAGENGQLRMHPSDLRQSPYNATNFTIGQPDNQFPMAQIKSVNSPTRIFFNLTSDQVATGATLRIGTTLSFSGGRPQVTINGRALAIPSPPTKIDSRGFTRGAYRGYGDKYDSTFSKSMLLEGTNVVSIDCVSGNPVDGFLSPNYIYDAIMLFVPL